MVLENDEEYIHIKVVQELEYGQLKRRSVSIDSRDLGLQRGFKDFVIGEILR